MSEQEIVTRSDRPQTHRRLMTHQRRALMELRNRYGELKPSIAERLFDVYQRYRSNAASLPLLLRIPELSGPQEIWDHARLSVVKIEIPPDSTAPQLVLRYTLGWDDEHLARVFIWDWQVVRY